MKYNPARLKRAVNNRILRAIDNYYDQKICGQSLVKYVPSVYRDDKNGIGMTGSQSTPYIVLKSIFSHVCLSSDDQFLDVGCGKGRVLAYLLKEKCLCQMYGIEINEISGKVAEDWTKKYEQVHVTIGDAFKLDFNQYTVLFLNRPFLPKTFAEFLEILEGQLKHPITFIYWVDQQSGFMLNSRRGWTMKYREVLYRIHGLHIADCPQGYSIWEYDPGRGTTEDSR